MPTAYDVPGQILVERLAKKLFEDYKDYIKPPKWAFFVKTGPHKERAPDDPADKDYKGSPGWWYYRAASILRQVYLYGPIGVSRLRTRYGGIRKRGYEPGRFVKGYAKIIRTILQQLEDAKLIKKDEANNKRGRVITDLGRSVVDKIASEIYKEIQEKQGSSVVSYISQLTK